MQPAVTTAFPEARARSLSAVQADLLVAVCAAVAMFLLASVTPDIPSGFDSYRHVKMAWRLSHEWAEVFKDPWRLAYLWPKPVDPYIGFHLILAPFTWAFELITAIKVLGALTFGGSVFVVLRLLAHFAVEQRVAWMMVAMAGSGITLFRQAVSRPYVLAIFLVLLIALWTFQRRPLLVGLASAALAFSYSMFFLAAMVPGVWLVLRRDRASLWTLGSCGLGMLAGIAANPYFPETLHYVLVNATATEVAARAGVEIGGELWPMNPLGFVASSSAVVLLWCAALVYRARRWRETPVAEARDVLLILSLVTLAGAFRVGRTLDFFVPFAMLYAGMELTPWIRQNRQRAAHFGAIAMLLCAANVGLAAKSALDSIPVERYRGVAAYLEREAPGELVINAFSSSYYYLYFWNSQNRYFIGIEPTFTYLNAPAEYWTWRHFSNDEPVDASAAMAKLHARYLLTEHARHPRLEASLNAASGAVAVYRDAAVTLYRFD